MKELQEENIEQRQYEDAIVEAHNKRKRPLWRRFIRFIFRSFVGLILLLLLLRVLIIFTPIQNKVVDFATNFLSEKLQTPVKIDHIAIKFWDDLVLDGFYIASEDGKDTLAYIDRLFIDFHNVAFLKKKIQIDEISLEGVDVNMIMPLEDGGNNFDFIMERLGSKDTTTKEAKPIDWFVDLNSINLKYIDFNLYNPLMNNDINLYLPYGKIKIGGIDLKTQMIDIHSVKLYDLISKVALYPREKKSDTSKEEDNELLDENPFLENPFLDVPEIVNDVMQTQNGLQINVNELKVFNGKFDVDNYIRNYPVPEGEIDYDHLKIYDIAIALKSIVITSTHGDGIIENISAKERTGLEIKHLASKHTHVERSIMQLNDMVLETNNSILGDTLIFKYPHIDDWGDYINIVEMDFRSHNSKVMVQDLLDIAPVLKENAFFRENAEEIITLDGIVYDRVMALKGKDLKLNLNNTLIDGQFSSFNIINTDKAVLNLKLNRVVTNMRNIRLLLPYIDIPDRYMKLGNINFSGNFDGFLLDFVTDGILRTNIGTVNSNIRMDLKAAKGAKYSGNLALKNFDLAEWLDDDNFGKISFNLDTIIGSGYRADDITTKVLGKIDSFVYKKYNYNNIGINGLFDKKLFSGDLVVTDENIQLQFDGKVDFNDSLPQFDLYTNIAKLDLKPLNLIDEEYKLKGGIRLNFTGDNPNNLVGFGIVNNFVLDNGKKIYYLDSLFASSGFMSKDYVFTEEAQSLYFNSNFTNKVKNAKDYLFNSPIRREFIVRSFSQNKDNSFDRNVDARLLTNFDILKSKDVLFEFLEKNYPTISDEFNLKPTYTDTSYVLKNDASTILSNYDESFVFNLNVEKTDSLTAFFDPKFKELQNLIVGGGYIGKSNQLQLGLALPQFDYANIHIKNIDFKLNAREDTCIILSSAEETSIGDSLQIPGITIYNYLAGDTLDFDISGNSIADIFQSLRVKGKLFKYKKDLYQIALEHSKVFIHDKEWAISDDNYIRFNDSTIITNNVKFRNKQETITLNSWQRKGLELGLQNVTLLWLKDFVDIENFDFAGRIDATVKAENIFSVEGLSAKAEIRDFEANGKTWGDINIKTSMTDMYSPLSANVHLSNDKNETLNVIGSYILPTASKAGRLPNSFHFRTEARNLPADIAEMFLEGIISKTTGTVDADVIMTGTIEDPNLFGNARLSNVGVTVDYLQTRYSLDYSLVTINNEGFKFGGYKGQEVGGNRIEGTVLSDDYGKTALLEGAITHDKLRTFEFDLKINSSEFLLMNTEKEDNDLFYGKAIGTISMTVKGDVLSPDVNIYAKTSKNTRIVLPLTYQRKASAVKFISFVDPNNPQPENNERMVIKAPEGVNLFMEIDVTPDAEILLIFNEQAGDIIQGVGEGNLRFEVTNDGAFEMFGSYSITEGEYLFTYQNWGINKPFAVKPGGRIEWSGDPYNANINLDTYYKNLKVPPLNFIYEYIATDESLKSLARKSTLVDLTMNLKNDLFQPDITFKLAFPNIDQNIQSYVESKLRTIKEDKNELNRQIFGLIILGNFLPSDESVGGGGVGVATAINTLSEMLSSQLSIYLTDLLSEAVGDIDLISSVDFDVDYRYHNFSDNVLDQTAGNEFQLGSKIGLKDDRWLINVEGNIGTSYNTGGGTYFAGDVEVEYLISADGRIRISAYTQSDQYVTGARRKTGVGASYRREFDTFEEFLDGLLKNVRKKSPSSH